MTSSLWVQAFLSGVTNGFVYGLIGLGIAVVFRGARIINAMQGDFALLGGVVAYLLVHNLGWPLPAAILAAALSGAVCGVLVERLLVRPTAKRQGTDDSYLLVTLGGAFAVSASVLLYFGRDSYVLPGIGGDRSVDVFNAAIRIHALALIVIGTLAVIGLRWFYGSTRLGQAMLAASIDPEGAQTIGINVPLVRALTFGLGGLVGGLAGVLVSPLINLHYEMGLAPNAQGLCRRHPGRAHQSVRCRIWRADAWPG